MKYTGEISISFVCTRKRFHFFGQGGVEGTVLDCQWAWFVLDPGVPQFSPDKDGRRPSVVPWQTVDPVQACLSDMKYASLIKP